MKFLRVLLLLSTIDSLATAATYHVDSRAGNDARDGLTSEHAWRTLAKVNTTTFAPGDRILLRAGSVWEGVALHPLGSGTAAAPIVMDREGEGATPVIHGAGKVPWALGLENQEYWEIR